MSAREFIEENAAEIARLVEEARPTVEREAAHYLAGQKERLLCISAAEFIGPMFEGWLAKTRSAAGELDYRRGYLHGYSQAMDDLQAAVKVYRAFARAWQCVAQFFDGDLWRWRYERSASNRSQPPAYRPRRQAADITSAGQSAAR